MRAATVTAGRRCAGTTACRTDLHQAPGTLVYLVGLAGLGCLAGRAARVALVGLEDLANPVGPVGQAILSLLALNRLALQRTLTTTHLSANRRA